MRGFLSSWIHETDDGARQPARFPEPPDGRNRPPADRQPEAILAADPGKNEGNSGCGLEGIPGEAGRAGWRRFKRLIPVLPDRPFRGESDQGFRSAGRIRGVIPDHQTSCDGDKSRTISNDKKSPSFPEKRLPRQAPRARAGPRPGPGKLVSIPIRALG